MIRKTLAILGLVAATVVGGSQLGPAANAAPNAPAAPALAPKQTIKANGPALCNCTSANASLSVCHSEEVTVRVGGSVLSASTGQSSSSCGSQTVAPGNCIFFRYSFECLYRGVFFGWECHHTSSGLRERPAHPKNDC